MSPKIKDKSFPPVKVTSEFLEATKICAEKADKYLSDYIRMAVESYNAQQSKPTTFKEQLDKSSTEGTRTKPTMCKSFGKDGK
ncbi:MAG TPA: hypothetical protein VIK78_14595 [Ruminiclostridium sp.]